MRRQTKRDQERAIGAGVSVGRPDWPLLRRQAELAMIRDVLGGGAAAPRAVVVAGPPGIGKSRLLRAGAELALEFGPRVEWVVATASAAAVPLGAMSHLLSRDAGASVDGHLFAATAAALRPVDGPSSHPLLLVDDAHLLDAASAGLLHYLLLHGAVRAVITVHERVGLPDAITALWKDNIAGRVELRPLPDAAVDELIDHSLGGVVSGAARGRLRQLVGGNPLYLRELLAALVTAGSLTQRRGVWQWHGPLRGNARLRELVELQLRTDDADVRRAVELLACGGTLPWQMVAAEPGMAGAEQHGLIVVVADDRRRRTVSLASPMYEQVIRSAIPAARLRATYARLGELARAVPARRRDDVLRAAWWQLTAGEPVEPRLMVRAARQAMERGDLALAERCARAAADGGEPGGAVLLAVALWRGGRYVEAEALLAAGPPVEANRAQRHQWRLARLVNQYWGLVERERAGDLIVAASDTGDDAHRERAAVTARHALMCAFEGRLADAVRLASTVRGDDRVQPEDRLWAYVAEVAATTLAGRPTAAVAVADEGLRLAARHPVDTAFITPQLLIARATGLQLAGSLGAARLAAEHGYHNAASAGDAWLTARWAGIAGSIASVQGDYQAAVRLTREAVAGFEGQDREGTLRLHLAALASVLAATGETTEARELLQQSRDQPAAVHRVHQAQLDLYTARVEAAFGDRPAARATAMRGAAAARALGHRCVEGLILYDSVRRVAGERVGLSTVRRLSELAAESDSALLTAFADAAAVRARQRDRGRPEAMLRMARRFGELDAAQFGAELARAATDAYRKAGQLGRSAAAERLRRDLLGRCTGLASPAAGGRGLTRRQREVALLAGRGLSSREIATKLTISVRTADNHLGHVYAKLGVEGRTGLTQLIERSGL